MQFSEMFDTSPVQPFAESNLLAECIRQCGICAVTCSACADACLAEEMVDELRRCIRLNLDCADICEVSGRLLTRQCEPDLAIVRRQIDLCAAICRSCGDECQSHAKMHEHCRVCAEACRACEQACVRLLESLGGSRRETSRDAH